MTEIRDVFDGLGLMYLLGVIVMVIVVIAMTVDFVSGWRKASVRGERKTSYAASRSLTKFLLYEGMVMIGLCMDTMLHFAWYQFSTIDYCVPLMGIMIGIVLCLVEGWSVKEKAEYKQRKRIEEAAAVLASILDKETVVELLRTRLQKGGLDSGNDDGVSEYQYS